MWWQYPLHACITCVALQGFQIVVGTVLYCDTKKMKIEELLGASIERVIWV